MKTILLTIVCMMICVLSPSFGARADSRQNTAAHVRGQLAAARTQADSIKILYNVLDLLPRKEQPAVARVMDAIALRAGDYDTRLDLARQITACYNDDDSLARIEARVAAFPASQNQKETMLFLKMKRITVRTRSMTEADCQADIVRILSETEDEKQKSPSDQLLDFFTIVEHLRNIGSGDMLKKYLDRLDALAASTHFSLYAISNLIQSEAANIYTDAGDARHGVEADRKLQQIIDGLEKKYAGMGRRYRNYDVSRYVSLRRMMRNYKGLSRSEIDSVHSEVMKLAATSSDVRDDVEKLPKYRAFHAMATGDYATAIPLLKQILAQTQRPAIRKQLIEFLIDAAENVGDNATKIEALKQYTAILEEFNDLKAAERYRELQIKYDVQDLKTRNTELELENRNEEVRSARRIMTFVIFAFVLLFIILVMSLYHWGRFKKNSSSMGDVVDNVHGERERLKDEMFDLDTTDPLAFEERMESETWSKRLRRRGARWNNISLFMTRSIVNDLLYISCIGHNSMARHIEKTSLGHLLSEAGAAARDDSDSPSNVVVRHPDEEITVVTDRECLAALIENIFDLSVKYSPSHTVDISLRPAERYVDLLITTVGVRAASPDDPQLFDDFSLAKRLLRRKGAGLFICRLISMLLQCRFIPDTTFDGGCRYIFRIPRQLSIGVK